MSSSVLTTLHQRMPAMTPTEQRVAAHVVASPAEIQALTITDLAQAAGVSTSSIARFCRTLGFEGYPDFRMSLAADLAREAQSRERFQISDGDVDPADGAADVVSKIAYHEAATIEQTARDLDLVALDAVVDRVATARRIDLYGTASSGLAGQDLHLKLHRIGLFSQAWTDQHLALTSASLLSPADVAIAFSHSGRTLEVVQALAVARGTGATTVAITNVPDSPLAAGADIVLTTSANETKYRSGAMSSRIAQLAVVDFIFVRVSQRLYDRMATNLRLTFDAVRGHRID
ncbi:MurR/RpiR family transcriptional regulator [Cellulomonas sp. ATA003]|uniref:MurR/RpiR family transcriptional regulator n=1 Tax=Cellulomonas sp. ATA003 TaxID=3073064 RepID=UPI0028735197|nr:MurR/RpiR family transcriptional regulator [Cellulomonas sp. ATA003]WNB86418.1 MurR/RpiR family transcriptional regulator [Cellulomonas sp. ATA003]